MAATKEIILSPLESKVIYIQRAVSKCLNQQVGRGQGDEEATVYEEATRTHGRSIIQGNEEADN